MMEKTQTRLEWASVLNIEPILLDYIWDIFGVSAEVAVVEVAELAEEEEAELVEVEVVEVELQNVVLHETNLR